LLRTWPRCHDTDEVDRLLADLDRPSSTSSHHNQPQLVRNSLHDNHKKLSLSISLSLIYLWVIFFTWPRLLITASAIHIACQSHSNRARLPTGAWLQTVIRQPAHDLTTVLRAVRARYGIRNMVTPNFKTGKKKIRRRISRTTNGKVLNT
jgi:hypothetical protein